MKICVHEILKNLEKIFLCIIIVDNHTMIIVIYLNLSTFKYISNYMLIYVKILNPSNHLNILHADV